MGKKWDYDVPSVEIWREVLRVLKPGGHLLSFGGTRTYHRMVVNIEDAGFEIRDMIVWHYGSGFPKSLDVGKQMDKRGGQAIAWFGPWLTRWREANGISRKAVAALFPSKQKYAGKAASEKPTGCVGNWETGVSLPTPEQFNLICMTFGLPFASLEEAERAVIEERTMIQGGGTSLELRMGERREVKADVTAPASDPAKQWNGWGTALKPASEPIVVARKPLIGTVAENVLEYGTGAINVDGCRIGTADKLSISKADPFHKADGSQLWNPTSSGAIERGQHAAGRWPANIVFSHAEGCESVACVEGCPVAELDRQSGDLRARGNIGASIVGGGLYGHGPTTNEFGPGDSGGASRFFYCAKASRSERESGLQATDGSRANNHPTVKPIALMRYLTRLVTPPNGLVLDPFCGSGTTGMAALAEGLEFLGIEAEEQFAEIARQRCAFAEKKSSAG
jgi:DNA modification methylase